MEKIPSTLNWVAIFKKDLWTSSNFLKLGIFDRGIYSLLLTRCKDGELAGQFVYSDDRKMTLDDIVDDLLPKTRDRTDLVRKALNKFLELGLLIENEKGFYEIRKYAEKTGQCSESSKDVVRQRCSGSEIVVNQVLDNQGLTEILPTLEESRVEKSREEDRVVDFLVPKFDFCKTPSVKSKRDAIEDLIRQGVDAKWIEQVACDPQYATFGFWDIITFLKPNHKDGRQEKDWDKIFSGKEV